MNKDITQIMKFVPLNISRNHGWIQDEHGKTAYEAYIDYTSNGKRNGKTNNLTLFNELLARKSSRDLQKNMWTEGLANGTLSIYELINDNMTDIAFDCMKDILNGNKVINYNSENPKLIEKIKLENILFYLLFKKKINECII